jgi:hypothetical protein
MHTDRMFNEEKIIAAIRDSMYEKNDTSGIIVNVKIISDDEYKRKRANAIIKKMSTLKKEMRDLQEELDFILFEELEL